jgi:isoquinoline 1-oxidoreductase alpha subunit
MASLSLTINGEKKTLDVDLDTPLLWVLRDHLGMTGTKFGCGRGLCGSCVVLSDNAPIRSCVTPVGLVDGKTILTIEGLSTARDHPVQKAWISEEVPQCGYCQSGQIMSAVALLKRVPHPTDEEIDQAMGDVLCRCGTYQRIRRAIHQAAGEGGAR